MRQLTATLYCMERSRRSTSARSPADLPKKLDQRGGLRPERLLIGLALIVVGVIWSILNSTIWYSPPHAAAPPPHVPTAVTTSPRTINGLRLLPVLQKPDPTATSFMVTLSFDNTDGSGDRTFDPSNVRLAIGRVSVAPTAVGPSLHPIVLAPGTFSHVTVRFAHALVSGATLRYTATNGHTSVRWLLWS